MIKQDHISSLEASFVTAKALLLKNLMSFSPFNHIYIATISTIKLKTSLHRLMSVKIAPSLVLAKFQ